MKSNFQSSFVRAVSFQVSIAKPDDRLISQGLCAIALSISLIIAFVLHRKQKILKRKRQIAMLEQLWHCSSNGKVQ